MSLVPEDDEGIVGGVVGVFDGAAVVGQHEWVEERTTLTPPTAVYAGCECGPTPLLGIRGQWDTRIAVMFE